MVEEAYSSRWLCGSGGSVWQPLVHILVDQEAERGEKVGHVPQQPTPSSEALCPATSPTSHTRTN